MIVDGVRKLASLRTISAINDIENADMIKVATIDGWKGGEYKYHEEMEFYVAQQGTSREFKVVGFKEEDDFIILLTKIDKY